MRVAHIVGASEGADWFPAISAGLLERGHDLTAIIDARSGDLDARLQAAGIPTRRCHLSLQRPLASRRGRIGYAGDALWLAGCAIRLGRLLASLEPDLVLTHLFNAALLGRIAGAAAQVPLRMDMVASPLTVEAPLTRALDRLTLPLEHVVIAGSDRIRSLYLDLRVSAERLERVYYGADASSFDPDRASRASVRSELGLASDEQLVGQVAYFYAPWQGRVAPPAVRGRGVKGHETFLRAAQLVRAARPRTRFLLAGGARGAAAAAYRDSVRSMSSRLGLTEYVTFLGERTDVPEVLAALDVSVQCSLAENLGGTIESLLMRRPTVATRVGGMPEAVIDGRTGLLVEPDDPESLAAAIIRLLEDRRLAHQLGSAGRRHMLSGFTLEHTVAALDEIMRRRMAARGPSKRRQRLSAGSAERLALSGGSITSYLKTRGAGGKAG